MNLNFTPLTSKFSKFKPDPAFTAIVSMFIIAVVIVGVNQFATKQLATTFCTTQTELDSMIATQLSLQSQVYDIEAQISTNNQTIISLQTSLINLNSEITKITSLILSDYDLAQEKKKAEDAYALCLKTGTRRGCYSKIMTVYNDLVGKNNLYKYKLVTLNEQKTILESQIADADALYVTLNEDLLKTQGELNEITSTIGSVQLCTATEVSLCGDGVDNDGDSNTDCSDSDCSSDPACITSGCSVTGCPSGQSCDLATDTCVSTGACDPACGAGESCVNGVCKSGGGGCSVTGCSIGQICDYATDTCVSDGTCNPLCGANQTCSNGSCVDNPPECTSDVDCTPGNICTAGACVSKPTICDDPSACNYNSTSSCDYSCKAEACVIDSVEYTSGEEEMGNWAVTGTFFGIIKIKNKEAAKRACDPLSINCNTGWAKDEASVRAEGPWKYWNCYLDLGDGVCDFKGPKEPCTLYQP